MKHSHFVSLRNLSKSEISGETLLALFCKSDREGVNVIGILPYGKKLSF